MIGRIISCLSKPSARGLRRFAGVRASNIIEREEHTDPEGGAADGRRWIGYVDRVEGGFVRGWCCDLARPDESVCIEVLASNGKRRVLVASQYREDVAAAGFGSGNHGFEIDVGKLLGAGETASICFLDSKIPIGKGPISLDPQQDLLMHPMPPAFHAAMRQLAAELRLKHAEMQVALGSGAAAPLEPCASWPPSRQRRAIR